MIAVHLSITYYKCGFVVGLTVGWLLDGGSITTIVDPPTAVGWPEVVVGGGSTGAGCTVVTSIKLSVFIEICSVTLEKH